MSAETPCSLLSTFYKIFLEKWEVELTAASLYHISPTSFYFWILLHCHLMGKTGLAIFRGG